MTILMGTFISIFPDQFKAHVPKMNHYPTIYIYCTEVHLNPSCGGGVCSSVAVFMQYLCISLIASLYSVYLLFTFTVWKYIYPSCGGGVCSSVAVFMQYLCISLIASLYRVYMPIYSAVSLPFTKGIQ